jgi:adenylosuccinate lyase
MAQKENPVNSENVTSLARIVRSLVIPAYENVSLWHERDLTNSAAERILIPHACILLDEMLARSAEIFRTLRVYPERMLANLKATKGQVMAESVMMALSRKGLGRQEAHRLVRDLALKARGKDQPLEDVLKGDARVRKLLSQAEVSRAMDPEAYLGESERIVQSVLSKIR